MEYMEYTGTLYYLCSIFFCKISDFSISLNFLKIKVKEYNFPTNKIWKKKKVVSADPQIQIQKKQFSGRRNIIPERSTEIQETIMNSRKGKYMGV